MSSENKICHIQIYVSSVAGINFCEMELLLIARKGTKSIQSNHCRIDSHILTIKTRSCSNNFLVRGSFINITFLKDRRFELY